MQRKNVLVRIRMAIHLKNQKEFSTLLPEVQQLKNSPDEYSMLFNEILEAEKWDFLQLFLAHKKADNYPTSENYGKALLTILGKMKTQIPRDEKAIEAEKEAAAIALINADASLNKQNNDGNTALHLAVENNHHSIVTHLLAKDASLAILNQKKKAPIELASTSEMIETITSCRCAPLPIGEQEKDPGNFGKKLLQAVRNKNIEAAKCLLKAGAISYHWCFDSNNEPKYKAFWPNQHLHPLHVAMINNDPDMIAVLLIYAGEDDVRKIPVGGNGVSPYDFAKQVQNDALDKGWDLYLNYKETCRALATLIQGQRDPNSPFHDLPLNAFNQIAAHSLPTAPLVKHMKSDATITATRRFINEYEKGLLHIHSEESKNLVKKLKSILAPKETYWQKTEDTSEQKAAKIQKEINEFIVNSFKEKEPLLPPEVAEIKTKVISRVGTTWASLKTRIGTRASSLWTPEGKQVPVTSETDPEPCDQTENKQEQKPTAVKTIKNRATVLLFQHKLDGELLEQTNPGEFKLKHRA